MAAIDHQLFSCDFVFFVVKNAFPDAMLIAAGLMARPHFLNALGRDVEIVIRLARHNETGQVPLSPSLMSPDFIPVYGANELAVS